MKKIYLLLYLCVAITTLMISCSAKDCGYVVHKEDIPMKGYDYWREYFTSQGNDTMAASFHFVKWKGNQPHLTIDFVQEIKRYQIYRHVRRSSNKYKLSSYQDFLLQLDACLKKAETEFDISHLSYLEILLLDNLPEIAVDVSRRLKTDSLFNHFAINSALSKTSLKNDLNEILWRYHISVREVESREMIILVDAEDYAKQYNLSRDTLPDKIVGVAVYIGLKKTNCVTGGQSSPVISDEKDISNNGYN